MHNDWDIFEQDWDVSGGSLGVLDVGAIELLAQTAPAAALKQLGGVVKRIVQQEQKIVTNLNTLHRRQKVGMAAYASDIPQLVIGFTSRHAAGAAIAAAASSAQESEPNVDLRMTDLIVSPSIAADFMLNSINVGRINLICGARAVPADTFGTSVQRPPLKAPKLNSGTPATINVTNIAGAARHFSATVFGIDLNQDSP